MGLLASLLILNGCVPIPFAESTPLPAISAYLPQDMGAEEGELLVLIHFSDAETSDWLPPKDRPAYGPSRTARVSSNDAIVGRIMSAEGLRSIGDEYALRSSSFLGVLSIWGWAGNSERELRMRRLCVVTSRGEQMAFTPAQDKWTLVRGPTIGTQDRDALDAALRENGKILDGDAPCGVRGRLEWREADAPKAREYLMRLARRGYTPALPPAANQ